jgi:hypothetical protein
MHIPEILRLLVRIHRLNLLWPASLVWLLHKFKPLMRSPKTTVLENYNMRDFVESTPARKIFLVDQDFRFIKMLIEFYFV